MKVTQHAKERYAERIMTKENKTDVAVYISRHEEDIGIDIEKMIAYGKLIYSGKSLKNGSGKSEVYVKDLWVVIYDPDRDTVVTLYKIDLGVGKDYDKAFMSAALEQIEAAKADYGEKEKEIAEIIKSFEEMISENDAKISEYKSMIKNLEAQNQSYKQLIQTYRGDLNEADMVVREKVMVLTGRKIF